MTWWHRAACLWIAMALAASAFVVARFYQGSPVQSDILALLPPTERNPDAEAAVQALTRRLGNRALFLVAHEDAGLSKELARDFAARLRTSKAFVQVIDAVPKVDARIVNDTYQPYRASLLTPADRDALANNTFDPDTSLLRRMHQPFRMGIATDLTEDPFGFFQHWLSSLPLANSRLTTEDGMLVARDGKAVYDKACAACHGADLRGAGESPPLKGAPFLANWKGRKAGDLYTFVHQNMPVGAPGSLSEGDYRAVVAYVLQANGAKEGAPIGD